MATIRNLLLRLGVDVDPVDKGFAKAAKAVGKFDKAFGKVTKFGAISAGLMSATGAAGAFSAAIAPAAGAVVALPAAFAVTKVAAATLKVGLLGMSDAMGAMASGDAKKLKKSMLELAPSARQFVTASAGLLQSFEPVKKAVQQKLFEGLGKQMGPVAKNLMPSLKSGMVGVAGSFNTAGKEAIKFAATPVAKGLINSVFKSTKKIMDEAAKAVQPVLKGIAGLVVAGLPLAERMAKWAINGVKAAAAFASSKDGSEKLAGWAKKAGDTLEQLGRIAKNIGGFLLGMFKGVKPSGDGVLTMLESVTAKMDTFANSAGGQDKVKEVFSLLLEVLREVVKVLPIFLGPLGAIMKILSGMSPEVRGVVVQFLAFSVVGVALAGKLTGLLSVVKGVSVAAIGVGGSMIKFGVGLAQGSAKLGENAGAAAKAGAAVRTFGGAVGSGLKTAGSFTLELGKLALEKGKVALQAGLAATKTALMTGAQIAANVASKALAIGIKLVNAAMRANPIGIVITIITLLVAAIVLAYNKNETFRKIVQAVWAAIKSAISTAWNFIKGVFAAIVSYITGTLVPRFNALKATVSTVWNGMKTVISTVWNGIKTIFTNLSNFVTKTIPNAFQTGVKAIGGFWEKLKAVAKSPITFLVNTIYNNGIRKIWNWVADKIPGLGQLAQITGFATGGPINKGTTGTADDVLIAASRGEYVVNAASTRRNAGIIDYVNRFGKNKDILKASGYAGDPGGMGIPGYATGGIVGWVSSFVQKGKDFFMNGFYKAAQAALNPIVNLAKSSMGTTGFGGMGSGLVTKVVDGVLSKFKPLENKLSGGGGGKVIAAARSQIGVPYSWGGGGPGGPSYGIGRGAGTKGFDCSGLTEYAWYKAIGKSIGGTTYSQKSILERISTPRPGAVGQPHADHTYLMSAPGKIIEAPFTGGFVREVPMRSTPWWGWPKGASVMDDGGVVRPGWNPPIFNGTGKTEGVFTSDMIKAMAGGRGGNTYNIPVTVGPGTSPAEVGRAIVASIKEYERTNGTRWRGNP